MSLPSRVPDPAVDSENKHQALDVVLEWAEEMGLGYPWFVNAAVLAGWGGPAIEGLADELEEVLRTDSVRAYLKPPHTRSATHLSTGDFRLGDFDLSALGWSEIKARLMDKLSALQRSSKKRATDEHWQPLERVRDGGLRSVRTRYRWWIRHHCLKHPLSEIADSISVYDDVRAAVQLVSRELGISGYTPATARQ